jgi:succinyl-CoA synthetase beta subunit
VRRDRGRRHRRGEEKRTSPVPLVVRLEGTNVEEGSGKKIIRESAST